MAKKILIIDDEQDLVVVTKTRLESAGYTVFTAPSAEEAMAWLENNIPDLILLDLLLPEMRGEELCKLLKSDDKLKQVPVILFTAVLNDIPKITREIGADDYLTKPFKPEVLLEKIRKFMGRGNKD